MSLLYECINGIIQGGILDGVEGAKEGDEVATLCVNKLRGMIVLEGDPNRALNPFSNPDFLMDFTDFREKPQSNTSPSSPSIASRDPTQH